MAVTAAAVLLTACGPTVSPRSVAPKAASVDLVALWDSAVVCPDNPDAKLPIRPPTGNLADQYRITEAEIVNELGRIHAAAKSADAAADNVTKLKRGLYWVWWQIGISNHSFNRDPAIESDMATAMATDTSYFRRAQSEIETAIGQGQLTSVAVGADFKWVCLDG